MKKKKKNKKIFTRMLINFYLVMLCNNRHLKPHQMKWTNNKASHSQVNIYLKIQEYTKKWQHKNYILQKNTNVYKSNAFKN